ncbi:MAG: hypothetical protein AAB921_04090 [Patescibacteria group bacterium]
MKKTIAYALLQLAFDLACVAVAYGVYYVLTVNLQVSTMVAFAVAVPLGIVLWLAGFFFISFISSK